MNNNKENASGDAGFIELLSVTFIVLKLCGVIKWSWLWVLSPIWIVAVMDIAPFLIKIIVKSVGGRKRKSKKKEEESEK